MFFKREGQIDFKNLNSALAFIQKRLIVQRGVIKSIQPPPPSHALAPGSVNPWFSGPGFWAPMYAISLKAPTPPTP